MENSVIQSNLNCSLPIIISIPHSGTNYNKNFLKNILLSKNELQYSEDSYVDELLIIPIKNDISYVKALFPRSYVDVNRHPLELDPLIISTDIPNFTKSRSTKVQNGIGVIHRVSAYGNEIYDNPLIRKDIVNRLLNNYFPYHKTLKNLIKNIKNKYNNILILDFHSMPSKSIISKDIDIALGNNYNLSSSEYITGKAKEYLKLLNYSIEENHPYSGGYITKNYGKPESGINVLQIEINRSIYMDENTLLRNKNKMKLLSNNLDSLVRFLNIQLITDNTIN
jgi:N-formylglutamate deformylase